MMKDPVNYNNNQKMIKNYKMKLKNKKLQLLKNKK